MENLNIRHKILDAQVKHFQIAQELGISESMLSRRLNSKLTAEEEKAILDAIEQLADRK